MMLMNLLKKHLGKPKDTTGLPITIHLQSGKQFTGLVTRLDQTEVVLQSENEWHVIRFDQIAAISQPMDDQPAIASHPTQVDHPAAPAKPRTNKRCNDPSESLPPTP